MTTVLGKILRGAGDVAKAAVGVLTFQPDMSKKAVDDFNNLSGYTATQAKMKAQIDAANKYAQQQEAAKNGTLLPETKWYNKIPDWGYFVGFLILLYIVFNKSK